MQLAELTYACAGSFGSGIAVNAVVGSGFFDSFSVLHKQRTKCDSLIYFFVFDKSVFYSVAISHNG